MYINFGNIGCFKLKLLHIAPLSISECFKILNLPPDQHYIHKDVVHFASQTTYLLMTDKEPIRAQRLKWTEPITVNTKTRSPTKMRL